MDEKSWTKSGRTEKTKLRSPTGYGVLPNDVGLLGLEGDHLGEVRPDKALLLGGVHEQPPRDAGVGGGGVGGDVAVADGSGGGKTFNIEKLYC